MVEMHIHLVMSCSCPTVHDGEERDVAMTFASENEVIHHKYLRCRFDKYRLNSE
jgi:hypothetical protein